MNYEYFSAYKKKPMMSTPNGYGNWLKFTKVNPFCNNCIYKEDDCEKQAKELGDSTLFICERKLEYDGYHQWTQKEIEGFKSELLEPMEINTIKGGGYSTAIEEEPEIDIKKVYKAWKLIKEEQDKHWNVFYASTPLLKSKIKMKGEKKLNLMKIIMKKVVGGKGKQFNITTENEDRYKGFMTDLKPGARVGYVDRCEMTEYVVFKIIDYRKNLPIGKMGHAIFHTPYQVPFQPIKAMIPQLWTATVMSEMRKDFDLRNEKEIEKNKKRAYWKTIVDVIPGKEDIRENPNAVKFPCHVSYRMGTVRHIGMLITGYSGQLEYHLIMSQEQTKLAGGCCTLKRDTNLDKLMRDYDIEILKGETRVWKVGKFNV